MNIIKSITRPDHIQYVSLVLRWWYQQKKTDWTINPNLCCRYVLRLTPCFKCKSSFTQRNGLELCEQCSLPTVCSRTGQFFASSVKLAVLTEPLTVIPAHLVVLQLPVQSSRSFRSWIHCRGRLWYRGKIIIAWQLTLILRLCPTSSPLKVELTLTENNLSLTVNVVMLH